MGHAYLVSLVLCEFSHRENEEERELGMHLRLHEQRLNFIPHGDAYSIVLSVSYTW